MPAASESTENTVSKSSAAQLTLKRTKSTPSLKKQRSQKRRGELAKVILQQSALVLHGHPEVAARMLEIPWSTKLDVGQLEAVSDAFAALVSDASRAGDPARVRLPFGKGSTSYSPPSGERTDSDSEFSADRPDSVHEEGEQGELYGSRLIPLEDIPRGDAFTALLRETCEVILIPQWEELGSRGARPALALMRRCASSVWPDLSRRLHKDKPYHLCSVTIDALSMAAEEFLEERGGFWPKSFIAYAKDYNRRARQ